MLQISKQDAADIVDQLSNLIKLKINIVGSDAIIIANSDRERVGDFHEAANQIIQNKLEELVVVTDDQFIGTQTGTNLPLVIDGQIIGVVGITGPYEEARAYGQIIKKMTEILIQGKDRDSRILKFKQDKERFEIEWICDPQTVITDSLRAKGQEFNIDIKKPRRLLLLCMAQANEESDLKTDILHDIRRQDPDTIAFRNLNFIVAAINDRPDDKIEIFIDRLIAKYRDKDMKFFIGVDDGFTDMLKIHDQYNKAKKALISCSQLGIQRYCFYSNLNIELVLDEIPLNAKQLYISKIFKDFSKEEIDESVNTIKVFYEEDGSIKRAAARLNIHPNTLQYKLKRIEARTGLDPRKLKFAAPFSLAELFLVEMNNL
ncbi:sugar diacid recognition domain-containing protein [uncultured Sphaerochaeta sp.]|uniref:CdaR family transcriptional regulator n=1 Tax=uncultured Sphaerochaeta sp. TaxID=886478 RepID=UPI002A0A54DE|nr:sugar diacid recognition domain-containing protein [uncultured Sphaerochaeta sp.]